jgi:hypothetical protein
MLVAASSPRSARRLTVLRRPAALCALGALLGLVGCGHPATREECDEIITRSAEIELRAQHVTDAKAVADRVAAAKAAKGDELLGRCVGRRITDRALACVRRASSAEQVDRCLD